MLHRSLFLHKKANPFASTVRAFMEYGQIDVPVTTLRSHEPVPKPTPLFRLEFELFGKQAPLCTENFARLCKGDQVSQTLEAQESVHEPHFRDQFLPQLHYARSSLHRVVRDFTVLGGDVTEGFVAPDAEGATKPTPMQTLFYPDGTRRAGPVRDIATTVSVFGEEFDAGAELGAVKFDKAGLVGTAVSAPHKNHSHFFVLLPDTGAPHLDGTCVCFGRVTKGLEELKRWQKTVRINFEGRPLKRVQVTSCGML